MAGEVEAGPVGAAAAVEAVRAGGRAVAHGHVQLAVIALETGRTLAAVAVGLVAAHSLVLARIRQALVDVDLAVAACAAVPKSLVFNRRRSISGPPFLAVHWSLHFSTVFIFAETGFAVALSYPYDGKQGKFD